jgi:hypothetical protein
VESSFSASTREQSVMGSLSTMDDNIHGPGSIAQRNHRETTTDVRNWRCRTCEGVFSGVSESPSFDATAESLG